MLVVLTIYVFANIRSYCFLDSFEALMSLDRFHCFPDARVTVSMVIIVFSDDLGL